MKSITIAVAFLVTLAPASALAETITVKAPGKISMVVAKGQPGQKISTSRVNDTTARISFSGPMLEKVCVEYLLGKEKISKCTNQIQSTIHIM